MPGKDGTKRRYRDGSTQTEQQGGRANFKRRRQDCALPLRQIDGHQCANQNEERHSPTIGNHSEYFLDRGGSGRSLCARRRNKQEREARVGDYHPWIEKSKTFVPG